MSEQTREELERIREDAKVQADYLREVGGISDHYFTHERMASALLAVLDLCDMSNESAARQFGDGSAFGFPLEIQQAIEREMGRGER